MNIHKRMGVGAFCLVLMLVSGCHLLRLGPTPSAIESWAIGTSAGNLESLTEEKFNQLREAGFACIEIGLGRISSREDLDRMRKAADNVAAFSQKTGVQIWSLHIPYGRDIDISLIDPAQREKAIEEIVQLITLCQRLQPKKLVIHGSFEPIPAEERSQRLTAAIESLTYLTPLAAVYGAQLTVECLPRTCLGNTSRETLYIINQIDGLGVCCDVNHLLQETPDDYIKTVGALISTVHISDYDGVDERHWLPGAEEGIINWNNILGNLESIGYQGPFMFECRGSFTEKMECWKKLKSDYLSQK